MRCHHDAVQQYGGRKEHGQALSGLRLFLRRSSVVRVRVSRTRTLTGNSVRCFDRVSAWGWLRTLVSVSLKRIRNSACSVGDVLLTTLFQMLVGVALYTCFYVLQLQVADSLPSLTSENGCLGGFYMVHFWNCGCHHFNSSTLSRSRQRKFGSNRKSRDRDFPRLQVNTFEMPSEKIRYPIYRSTFIS